MSINKILFSTDRRFQILVALLITFLFFGIYIGHALKGGSLGGSMYSSGDFFRASYPGFIKVGSYLKEGIFSAVDLGINNGNGEMFLRTSLPSKNLIYGLFSYASALLNNMPADHYVDAILTNRPADYFLLALILFLSVICFYYAQKLATEFFNLTRYQALFFAVLGFIPVMTFDSLFILLFHFNITLVAPLAYFSLKTLKEPRHNWLAAAFFYVLVFTGGYITVSTFHAAMNIIFTFVYYQSTNNKFNVRHVLIRIGAPFTIATAACFLHYLAIARLLTGVVQTSIHNYYQSVDQLAVDYMDILGWVTPFRLFTKPLEQLTIASIGVIGIFLLGILLRPMISESKTIKFKSIFWFGVISFVIINFWAMGNTTTIPGLFHFLVPIVGSMHLQDRYLIPMMPFLFLSIAIGISYLNTGEIKTKIYKSLGIVFFVLGIVILLDPTFGTGTLKIIDVRRFSFELFFAALFFMIASIEGIKRKALIVACTYALLVYPTLMLQQVPLPIFEHFLIPKKINFNHNAIVGFNNFIGTLEKKENYRFLGMEELATSGHGAYITEDFEWFKLLDHSISNYSSYDIYISNPKDYQPLFFTIMGVADWQYIANTRGSFVVVDDDVYTKNKKVLDQMVDMTKTPYLLHWKPGGLRAYALKGFIPKQMSGKDFTLDPNPNSLDNGYFYSPDLKNDALVSFESNEANYVKAVINADKPSRMTYLFYPIQNQRLYIDGLLVTPTIDKAQMFFDIPEGTHTIELRYQNTLETIANIILILFYLTAVIYFIAIYFYRYKVYLGKVRNQERAVEGRKEKSL